MDDRNVTPDGSLLEQIFGTDQPRTISIILQNWDKCVFKADFSADQGNGRPARVVRLEAENEGSKTFTTIACLQKIAATVIPDLVPKTIQVGKAENAKGRKFYFSVMEYIDGKVLEDAWPEMDAENRSTVAAQLVEALGKLHRLQAHDEIVKDTMKETLREQDGEAVKSLGGDVFGGPHTGFFKDGHTLLDSIMQRRRLQKPACTLETLSDSQSVKLQSQFEDLGSVIIPSSDVDKWQEEAVLCHNDLNPHNLIVQSYQSSNSKSMYKLAGIIDWELAGFYPPAYELGLHDTYLSSAIRHLSFYLLLKRHMKDLVPRSASQVLLLQAMEIIFESQQRSLSNGTNIPAHIRKRFMENYKLVRDEDPYLGWTRKPEEGILVEYSTAEIQKLEDDVVAEMIARRKAMQDERNKETSKSA